MGRRKGKNKNKGKAANISEIEKSKVGFNAFIPGVTIILTENFMSVTLIQKLVVEFRTSYYHKFVILNAENYSKSYILKAVLEFVNPFSFQPAHYNKTKESAYFLATDCLKIIMKIVGNKFIIPHSTDTTKQFKLAIFVNCMLCEDEPELDFIHNIHKVLNKLYDPITRSLNLSNFSDNSELIYYCPLDDEKIFDQVMRQAGKLNIKQINLSNNSIQNLYSVYPLRHTLQVLDISSNNLEVISCLIPLTGFNELTELKLTDNPLCRNYSPCSYILDVKKYCPNLRILDGCSIVHPPEFVKNFMCTSDAKYLAAQFLEHFFITYDSPNRINLVHLYDAHAIFSVTSKIVPLQANSETVKLGHYGIKNPYAVYGIGEIMKLFQEFPKSYHDPYPMTCDVTLYTNTNALLTVTGIFREYSQILSFCRSFYFQRLNDEFRIVNEQLHVSNALDFQVGWSFTFPIDLQYSGNLLPYFQDDYKHFEEAMQKLTNMNLEYCQKYLVYCNYDLKKALTLFSELHVTNDVPKEAFEMKRSNSSNLKKTDFCEALKKKVLQAHSIISLKTIWATLNHERIENTNDPPITINRSISRLYKKPNVPVNFEEYPVIQDSTNLPLLNIHNSFKVFVSNTNKLKNSYKSFLQKEANTNAIPIPKAPQTNPLLDLANKMARNKEIVLNQMEKSNESTQQKTQNLSTSSFIPPQQISVTSSNQPSTTSGRLIQSRPTAIAFFNSPHKSPDTQPGPSRYIPEGKKPRPSKLINIPLAPKKNISLQPTNTNVVYNLASTIKTQNNVPVKETLTTDTITILRENLQKEKQRLQNIIDKKTVHEKEKNKAASPQQNVSRNIKRANEEDEGENSIVKKAKLPTEITPKKTINSVGVAKVSENIEDSKDMSRELESNIIPENTLNVENTTNTKQKKITNKKLNNNESCIKPILDSGKRPTSKDKISDFSKCSNTKTIMADKNYLNSGNKAEIEKNGRNKESSTSHKKPNETLQSTGNETASGQNISTEIAEKEQTDESNLCPRNQISEEKETISTPKNETKVEKGTVKTGSVSKKVTTVKDSEINKDFSCKTTNQKNGPTDITLGHNYGITEQNQTVQNVIISDIETITCVKGTSNEDSCQTNTQIGSKDAEKTGILYPEFTRNLVVRLYNLSKPEIEEMVTSTPALDQSSLKEASEKSGDINASFSTVDLTDDSENGAVSGNKTKVKINLTLLKSNATLLDSVESATTTLQTTEDICLTPPVPANEELLDKMETVKHLKSPLSKPKLTLLEKHDPKLEADSHSDTIITVLDDNNQTESQNNEQLQVDSEAAEEMAITKKEVIQLKNLVIPISRTLIDKYDIMKQLTTSSKDNFEIQQIIEGDFNEIIQKTNKQPNEVDGCETKTEPLKMSDESGLQSTEKLEVTFKLDEQDDDDDDIPLSFWNIESDDDD